MAAAQHEAEFHGEPMLSQQQVADTAISADAAAANEGDGSPDSASATEDADEKPSVEEEPSERERSAAGELETTAAAEDDEDDIRALEEAATGGMAEDEIEEPPADEDENAQPQPSVADLTDEAPDASSVDAMVGGAAEPDIDGVEISSGASAVPNGEPVDGDQGPEQDQDELSEPPSDPAADAVPQTEPEQPEAVADGIPDAGAAPAEAEPLAGSAASVEGVVGATAVAAAEDAAAGGDEVPDASLPEAAAPMGRKRAVPAWRRAHDSADIGDEASAEHIAHNISAPRSFV